jgi:hypothetical protein
MSGYPPHPSQPQPACGHPQPAYPGQPPAQAYPYAGQPVPQAQAGNPFADQPVNPYAAPQQAGYYPQMPAKLSPFAGLWREGNLLVMHKLAPLPDICLKSNEPATGRIQRKLQWHHPLLALTIFIGIPVYIVLALVLMKRATIHVPLTDEWIARRKRRMIVSWTTGLACLGLMVGGIVLTVQTDDPGYLLLMILGIFGGLIALIAGQAAVGLVTPKRMTDEYIWLKGVHPEYLNRLEPWPYRI